MTAKTLAILALPVMLLGCASKLVFDLPPGGTEAQFHRDNIDCAITAKAVVGDSFVMGAPLFVAAAQMGHNNAMREAAGECMLGKGYTLHDAS
jgi:hypothetical protein